jgi:uncharacterized membrane protein YhhN
VSLATLLIAGGLGTAHLVAYYAGRRALAGLLKALPILLLAWTVSTCSGARAPYARLVTIGLVASAVGDVSLVFAGGFLAGLSAFFVAHLCYIGAFARGAVVTVDAAIAAVLLAVVAAAMLHYLWPHVARVRAPVVLYVAALSGMAWLAIARATGPQAGPAAASAALGAVTFLASDGMLAVDRFARRFAGAHAAVMLTYYAAQMLIARSAC